MVKQFSAAADRNKDPILLQLKKYYKKYVNPGEKELCLEISSGTGQHVSHFAKHFPNIIWQPSDCKDSSFSSISEYCRGLINVNQPIVIDVLKEYSEWNIETKISRLCFEY